MFYLIKKKIPVEVSRHQQHIQGQKFEADSCILCQQGWHLCDARAGEAEHKTGEERLVEQHQWDLSY
jgi:hypothetical protein